MRQARMRVLAGLVAALLLALAAGSAHATSIEYSEQLFRILFARLAFAESGGGVSIRCPVTLEGSFHESTFAPERGDSVAGITSAQIGACQEGEATILERSLPWDVTFQSFTGTLPNITTIRHELIGAAFEVEPGLGIRCLALTTRESPAAGDATREAGGQITSLLPDSALAIPVTGELCPAFGVFDGAGEVFVQGSTERRVTLTLI